MELGFLILNHIGSISGYASCVNFLENALPCMITLCSCFPTLIEPTVQILLDMKEDKNIETKITAKPHSSCREVRCDSALQKVVTFVFDEIIENICEH